jgi:hypothetical protein
MSTKADALPFLRSFYKSVMHGVHFDPAWAMSSQRVHVLMEGLEYLGLTGQPAESVAITVGVLERSIHGL